LAKLAAESSDDVKLVVWSLEMHPEDGDRESFESPP